METFTRDLGFVNFEGSVMEWVKVDGVTVYEAFKELIVSGVPPITLLKSKGANLVDYKMYGNSKQNGTPTPDTPIEIESVGDKTKNVYDYTKALGELNEVSTNGITFKIVEDGILVNGTATASANSGRKYNLKPYLEAGKTYTASSIGTGVAPIFYSIENGTANWNRTKTITGNEDSIALYLQVASGVTVDNVLVKIQLEEGTTATEYEPYGYKIPVKVSGKNLFNINNLTSTSKIINNNDGTITVSGYAVICGETLQELCPELKVGDIAYLTMKTDGAKLIYLNNGVNWDVRVRKTITQEMLNARVYFYNNANEKNTPVKISDIQIELDEITNYEPYKEPITTNIYLNEPLRKLGSYADYIDFENKKVVRRIYNDFITKVDSKSSMSGTYALFLSIISKKPLYQNYKGICMSNKFALTDVAYSNLKNYGGIIQSYVTSGGGYRVAYTFPDTNITTVAQANEIIGDGFEVCYVLAKPLEETIELPNIPTHKGTTIIEIDTDILPSNMEVTYMGKK